MEQQFWERLKKRIDSLSKEDYEELHKRGVEAEKCFVECMTRMEGLRDESNGNKL